MQVIASARRVRPARVVGPVAVGVVVGLTLLLGGLLIAYVAFATPLLGVFSAVRPSAGQVAFGALAWTLALVAPTLFGIVGLFRLFTVAEELMALRRRPAKASRFADILDDDYVVANRLSLPDGRLIPELVIGPFGAAVIGDLPPAGAGRNRGGRWEVRMTNGRWAPIENPLDRATRDAERVRRWFGQHERDHLVRVYSAVVTADPAVHRTPDCATIAPDQLAAWLSGLPPQRGLTPTRRANLVELIRAAV